MSQPPAPTPDDGYDDSCPECRADWKRSHHPECSRFHRCEFPPGCSEAQAPGRRLCPAHHRDLTALFAPLPPRNSLLTL